MPDGGRTPRSAPDPRRVHTQQELVLELDRLRRRAARGSQRPTVSLERLSRLTGIPRSTVHAYVSGMRLPPPDVLDTVVTALGASRAEQADWADALDRITEPPGGRPEGAPGGSADQDVPAAADTQGRTVPHQLPGRPTGFVGREAELARLDELSSAADSDPDAARVFALTGTGGVGKTALALTWAHRGLERSPDGQLWIDLRGVGPGSSLATGDALEEMLRAVGVQTAELPASVDARAALFRTAVAGRRMLLVLDNARDAAHVRPLVPGTPGIITVVTSRNTMRSLVVDGAARIQLERLRRAEARSLLAAELPAELTDSAAMTRIVDRCEGLPLTLRIVRERLAGEPAAEAERIAAQFEREGRSWLEEFDLPEDAGDVSMRAALRWSYRALPEAAARAFRLLPLCLVPTIDLHCVSALLDTDPQSARRLLDTLVSANLLDPGDQDGYRVHDLVVSFAAEVLGEGVSAEEVHRARVRLLRAVGAVCESAGEHTDPGRPMRVGWPDGDGPGTAFATGSAALDWVLAHIELVAAATSDAAASGPAGYSWLLAERGWRSLRWIADVGRLDDAVVVACDAAIAANAFGPAVSLNRLRGVGHALRSDLKGAEAIFRHGISLAVQAGDPANEAVDRQNRALVWAHRGEVTDAIGELTELVERGRLHDDERVPPLVNLIELELSQGETAAASGWLDLLDNSIAAHGVSEALALEARLCAVRIELARGAHDPALLDDLIEIEHGCDARRNRELVAECLIEQARFHRNAGHPAGAVELARRAHALAEGAASRIVQTTALCLLAETEGQHGDAEYSKQLAERAVTLAQSVRLRHQETLAQLSLARASFAMDEFEEAEEAAAATLQLARASGYRPLAAAALSLLERLNGQRSVAGADR